MWKSQNHLTPPLSDKVGKLKAREILGFTVLAVALAWATSLHLEGRTIMAWMTGAAGFTVAALIAGKH